MSIFVLSAWCLAGELVVHEGVGVRAQGRAMGSCPFPEDRVNVWDVKIEVESMIGLKLCRRRLYSVVYKQAHYSPTRCR